MAMLSLKDQLAGRVFTVIVLIVSVRRRQCGEGRTGQAGGMNINYPGSRGPDQTDLTL